MPTPRFLSPTGSLIVRPPDAWASGGGAYLAARSTGDVQRQHLGLDLVCKPNGLLLTPCTGRLIRIGYAYPGDTRYYSVHMTPDGFDDIDIKVLYLAPGDHQEGDRLLRGEILGRSQDLSQKYPGITQHCHYEMLIRGIHVDPSAYLDAQPAPTAEVA